MGRRSQLLRVDDDAGSKLELSLGDGLKIPGEPGTPEMFEL